MGPRRNPEVAWWLEQGLYEIAREKARRQEDYEDLGVLTLMRGGSIQQLNLVGAEIWTRINGINTAERIAAEVASLFGFDLKATEEEVAAFLEGIARQGLISLSAAPAPPKWTAG